MAHAYYVIINMNVAQTLCGVFGTLICAKFQLSRSHYTVRNVSGKSHNARTRAHSLTISAHALWIGDNTKIHQFSAPSPSPREVCFWTMFPIHYTMSICISTQLKLCRPQAMFGKKKRVKKYVHTITTNGQCFAKEVELDDCFVVLFGLQFIYTSCNFMSNKHIWSCDDLSNDVFFLFFQHHRVALSWFDEECLMWPPYKTLDPFSLGSLLRIKDGEKGEERIVDIRLSWIYE